ncbi:uncharacterized protein LAJ45_10158 [Morchella importuna]|uniref:uncharacterized protein n=1 Tax=Morchella importuna TaxID=1174673 RepID=UPI001E8CE605|nr:uncharacterized protein LAJ45_10158 [Morchella importuna]KAH8145833.1 hypothetical protein LAJ45_10158 [Morchella importuna]
MHSRETGMRLCEVDAPGGVAWMRSCVGCGLCGIGCGAAVAARLRWWDGSGGVEVVAWTVWGAWSAESGFAAGGKRGEAELDGMLDTASTFTPAAAAALWSPYQAPPASHPPRASHHHQQDSYQKKQRGFGKALWKQSRTRRSSRGALRK